MLSTKIIFGVHKRILFIIRDGIFSLSLTVPLFSPALLFSALLSNGFV